jgi:hypothetical protein
MIAGDYAAGSTALILTIGSWVVAARRIQRRVTPSWSGADAALVTAVLGTAGVLVVAEVLGIVHSFGRWRMAAACLVVALLVSRFVPVGARRDGDRSGLKGGAWWTARSDLVIIGCSLIAVVAVAAALVARLAEVLHTGPLDGDSLHYHLVQSAYFVQSHSIDGFHQVGSSDLTPYYPFNAELLDAVLMQGPRPDLATLPLNLGCAALLLLACWVVGDCWSSGWRAVGAGCLLLALPIARAGAGPGLNDLPAIAFLVAAIAVLARADLPRGLALRGEWTAAVVVAGLALGLSAGTKISILGAAVLTGLGVVALARGDRVRVAGALGVSGAVAGGFWYLRDWVHTGSPVPEVNLTVAGHGWHAIPIPEVKPYAFSVAHYLGDGSVVRHWFVPGLRAALGHGWVVLLLLLVAGVVAGLAQRHRFRIVLSVVAVASFAVYAVTPTTALGPPGAPTLFAVNTRYALPALALALLLAGTATLPRRVELPVAVGLLVLTAVTLARPSGIVGSTRMSAGIAGALVLTVAVAWLAVVARHARRSRVATTAALVTVVVVAAGAVLQHHYRADRYGTAVSARASLYSEVARDPAQHRVGVVGLAHEYPFYGATFSNVVNYVGVTDADGAYGAPRTCQGLVTVLAEQRDDRIVVEPLALEHTAQIETWLQALGARAVISNPQGAVYALPATLSVTNCVE